MTSPAAGKQYWNNYLIGGMWAVSEMVGGGLGGMTGAAGAGMSCPAKVPLFRAVKARELNSLQQTGKFLASPHGSESKYSATTLEGAQRYAQMASKAFGEQYWIVETSAPPSAFAEESLFVNGGVQTQMVPNANLNQLTAPVFRGSFP
jgi:hypothetical protein